MTVHADTPRDGNVPRDAHPEILMLVRYWQYIHTEGRLPGSAHFNLDDIPGLRPNIRLIDVVEGGPFRYRIRMIGEEHRRQLGYDPTGSWYENITDRFKNSIVELDLARVCHWMQPVYRKGETIVPYASGSRIIERVHVPLASDGRHVDAIASLTLFFPDVRKVVGTGSVAVNPADSEGTNLLAPVPADGRETAVRQRLEAKSKSRPSA